MFPMSRRIAILGKSYYYQKVLSTRGANLIGYWPLWEASGTTAYDKSSQVNDGAYGAAATAPTLGQPGIGDGRTCPSFDGGDYVNIYSAGLNGDFNGQSGTMMAWAKINNAAIWTDGNSHTIIQLRVDASNLIAMMKYATDNQLRWQYTAGGTTETLTTLAYGGSLAWFHMAITWNLPTHEVIVYINGAQIGTAGTLGTWAGALAATLCCIGASATTPGTPWTGQIAHVPIWNTPLTQPEIVKLATP